MNILILKFIYKDLSNKQKSLVLVFTLLVVVIAEIPSSEYLPALHVDSDVIEDSAPLIDDGYHYKTVRTLKYRHRRDVSELPSSEYLPPATEYLPPVEEEHLAELVPSVDGSTHLEDDGYHYKTIRKLKYRQRRELPSAEYLTPIDLVIPSVHESEN